jgi:hypothetical protein
MDNYVIVSGPALATSSSAFQYLALLDTATGQNIASLEVDRGAQIKTMIITGALSTYDEIEALLDFVLALTAQFRGQYLSLTDMNARKMADVVTFCQSIGALSAKLNKLALVAEAKVSGYQSNMAVNSVRFENDNIVGLAQVTSPSDILMTIKGT